MAEPIWKIETIKNIIEETRDDDPGVDWCFFNFPHLMWTITFIIVIIVLVQRAVTWLFFLPYNVYRYVAKSLFGKES